LVTAQSVGTVNITVINGPAEQVIPVHVETPPAQGPATVGADGGVVVSNDGSYVTVPPDDLPADKTISITPAIPAALPQPVPDGFQLAAAFTLDVGPDPLAVPVQLAIKVPANIVPGTTVYFYQAGDFLNDDGTTRPIWWQVESGVVGDAKQPRCEPRRIVKLTQVLIGLQENILAEIQRVLAIAHNTQQVIVDALFPSGNQEVIRLHVSPARLAYQVGVFDRPKNQCSGSLWNDAPHAQKVCGVCNRLTVRLQPLRAFARHVASPGTARDHQGSADRCSMPCLDCGFAPTHGLVVVALCEVRHCKR
jgi:hypothetical protein